MISKKVERNKLIVHDLFAGAGGFGLGFELTQRYKVNLSLEKDLWAVNTLIENKKEKDKIIVHDDIRSFQSDASIVNITKNCNPDIIIGGPPCQGFSIQGPVKDPNDPRNTLFVDFARWVRVLKPKVFVIENVVGILKRCNSEGQRVIDIIVSTFEQIGYNVEVWNLNSANYGVPQLRNRVFIVGNNISNDKITPPEFTHSIVTNIKNSNLKPAVTVGQAISDLPIIEAWQGAEQMEYDIEPTDTYQRWARSNSKHVFNHVAMNHTKRLIERYRMIQKGEKLDSLPEELKVRKRNGNGELSNITFSSNYRHLKEDSISYTVPASFYSTFIHPTIPRNITSREAARIQSFPDWYIFKGKRTVLSSKLLHKIGKDSEDFLSQYNQIGNAVPPLLARAIANRIADFIELNN